MSGTGFGVAIKSQRGATAAPSALYEELYGIIGANVRRVAKGKAYAQVTEEYLSVAREDGAGRAREIEFLFHDSGGVCSASVHACHHWFELYVSALARAGGKSPSALDEIAARHGLAIAKKPAPLATLLKTCVEPLVVLRGHVFGIGVSRGRPHLVSDALDDAIEIEDLTAKERATVDAAVKKKRCACVVCETLRKSPEVRVPKAKKAAPAPPKLPKTKVQTELSYGGTYRSVRDDRCTELPDELFAPPKLETLAVRAPIATIPDGIERLRSLRKLSLSRTKIAHLPEVLARMPSIVEIHLDDSPLQLAELAKMPWLEAIELSDLRTTLADFPFEALPKLQRLEIRELGLEQLPPGLSRARELRVLKVRDPLRTLPSLDALTKLEELDLEGLRASAIPSLAHLASLRKVSIDAESLTTFPELPRGLRELVLRTPELRTVSSSLGEMSSLESLVIHASFTELPRAIGELPALRELCFGSSELTTLPALPRTLQSLTMYCEALKTLPDSIGELASLERLQLSRMAALGPFPKAMARLEKLNFLSLSKTPGVFPLPDFLAKLPIEYLGFGDEPPRGERARWKRLLPNAKVE